MIIKLALWIVKLKEPLSKLKALLSPWKYPEPFHVSLRHPSQFSKALLTNFPAAVSVLSSFFHTPELHSCGCLLLK